MQRIVYCSLECFEPITKHPLLQESRLTGGGSPNLVGVVERKALLRDLWELQIVSIIFIHYCTFVLYKQLIQTGFGCYCSDFTLCRAFLSMRTQTLGEPPHTSPIALQERSGLAVTLRQPPLPLVPSLILPGPTM